ncbi:MAG: hypothetical protein IT209_00845 [Armatimonadetes bacterium]|nr:hypothetical protein [Armatimonadota bacterium]
MSYWGNRKPPLGVRYEVDWGHPLAKGLKGINIYNGENQWKLSNRDTKHSSGISAITRDGIGMQGGGMTTMPDWYALPSQPLPDFTLICRMKITSSTSSSNNYWLYSRYASRVDDIRICTVYQQVTTDYLRLSLNDFQLTWNSGFTVKSGDTWTIAVTYSSPNAILYIDGVEDSSGTGSQNTRIGNSAMNVVNPQNMGGNSNPFGVYQMMYDRALSPEEIMAVQLEPYAMILPPDLPVFYSIPSAAFQAAWAMNSNLVLS